MITDINDIKNVEVGDLILIKNNSIFNDTYVECIVEKKTSDYSRLKVKWQYEDTDNWGSRYVDFADRHSPNFVEILERGE